MHLQHQPLDHMPQMGSDKGGASPRPLTDLPWSPHRLGSRKRTVPRSSIQAIWVDFAPLDLVTRRYTTAAVWRSPEAMVHRVQGNAWESESEA